MSLEDSLEELAKAGPSGSDVRVRDIPEKWRPFSEVGPDGGFAISTPHAVGNTPGGEAVLKEHDLDPEQWVVTHMRHAKWQTYDGRWLESSRVSLAPRRGTATELPDFDLEELVDEIRIWTPRTGLPTYTGDGAYVFAPSDQQLGKKAAGQGTQQSVNRILQSTERGVHRLERLRKAGLGIGTIALPLPGDHVEGITSQAGRLQGQAASDLGLTQQTRVGRRLLTSQIKAFAPLAEEIIVPVINGNHDEVTRQVAADPADGWNVEIASAVQDACAENPNLAHVKFRFPDLGHQTLTVNIQGTLLGLFHGHQAGRDVEKYLSGQSLGQTALGGADVWISGHFHNYRTADIGERLWVQAPTTDPGSEWFRDRRGQNSKPGVVTMVIGENYDPREWLGVIPVD